MPEYLKDNKVQSWKVVLPCKCWFENK